MKTITINCEHISKSFTQGDTTIPCLTDINFKAYASEMIMLMGPSGSGKTTLISIIGGILNQDSGTCTILNVDMSSLSQQEKTTFRGKTIGFVFQTFNLVPTLTALENAAIPLLLTNHTETESYAQATKLLSDLGLGSHINKKPKDLSGGEQQRVAIARGCIHKPTIMLCDEPTSFLDLERGKKIMELLHMIKEEHHCTIIVVTHDPRILPFADRILRIEDGHLIEDANHTKS